ncbi:MAG: metalloregulator ArsR/SmtB family transcription factor [Phycisphaeraceae bacterium]
MSRPYRTRSDERDIFRALAHPIRRQIVAASAEQARSFDQLCQLVHRSNATVAGHLRILREARLITATRTGRSVRYQTNRQGLRSGTRWLSALATPSSP